MQLTEIFQHLSQGVFPYLWWSAPVLLAGLAAGSPKVRGWFARRETVSGVVERLDDKTYHRFRNLALIGGQGGDCADCVLVSPYGIFVIALPEYGGYILGGSKDGVWSELSHSVKTDFANPLRQNQQAIALLSKQLELPASYFHSLVVFERSCRFRSMMPDNVMEGADLSDYIAQFDVEELSAETVCRIKTQLEGNEFDSVFGKRTELVGAFKPA